MELIAMALVIGVIVMAQFILYDKIGMKGVSYKLTVNTDEVFEGEEIEIIEEIENAKRLPLVWARSEISCSKWLSFKGKTAVNTDDEQRSLISGIFVLKGYQKCRRVWTVRCEKRGIMTISDAVITASDLFGMAKPSLVVKIDKKVRVLPVPCETEIGDFSGDMFFGNMQVQRFVLPDPFVISGAREYTGREPMNRIHWNQTARSGKLMVYNNEFTTERRVMIILNMQRSIGAYLQSMTDSTLECEIKAAAYAIDLCGQMNAEYGIAANSENPLFVPAGEGYEHRIDILRNLAEITNVCGERLEDLLDNRDFTDYTDILLITVAVSERVGEKLAGLAAGGKCCKILSTGINEGSENVPEAVDVVNIPWIEFSTNAPVVV